MATDSEPVVPELDDDAGSRARAWLQLFRLPNVFTAMADIFLGFLLVHETLEPWWTFLLLLGASCLLYTSGMVLNDVFDVVIDRQERPSRPLPSGRIPLRLALHVGGVMLGAGVALGWAAGAFQGQFRSGLVATALAGAVLAYDRILKRTIIAPAVMGSCRTLNILLGKRRRRCLAFDPLRRSGRRGDLYHGRHLVRPDRGARATAWPWRRRVL